jgi:hypothetical protein
VVCGGSDAISFSMASMSVATEASFSFKRSAGACGMANSVPLGGPAVPMKERPFGKARNDTGRGEFG